MNAFYGELNLIRIQLGHKVWIWNPHNGTDSRKWPYKYEKWADISFDELNVLSGLWRSRSFS